MSNLKITIHPRAPEAAKFDRDGVVRHYYKQWAILEVDGMPTSFEFSVDEPLPPGEAMLSPKSFGVMNGKLALSRVTLIPVAKPAALSKAG